MIKINKSKKLSHLSFKIKKFLQFYPWKDCTPSQFKNLDKKLSECNVAIVSSAGFVIKNKQKPFDINDKFGDSSYRVIPSNINSNELEEYQKSNSFDHSGIKSDPFSALPISHLYDLCKDGLIGSVNSRHISLMGANINTSKLIKKSVPEIVQIFKEDKVDIILFIPV
ncbi:MAG: hypothetical protein CMG07_04375 [Candidatus Marinimicrobia bacterium]|nr:hypothetical protein [Candidatus Neomarinimicrobiota bacterium]